MLGAILSHGIAIPRGARILDIRSFYGGSYMVEKGPIFDHANFNTIPLQILFDPESKIIQSLYYNLYNLSQRCSISTEDALYDFIKKYSISIERQIENEYGVVTLSTNKDFDITFNRVSRKMIEMRDIYKDFWN